MSKKTYEQIKESERYAIALRLQQKKASEPSPRLWGAAPAPSAGRFIRTSLLLPAMVTNAVLAAARPRAKHIPARVSTLVQHQATQPVVHRFA